MSAIRIEHISKSYGKAKALQDISLHVAPGSLFGLIGPDGAGKTSLFRILSTLTLPDSGQASIGAYSVLKNIYDIRRILGYMPGRFSLYQDLTVEENLSFFATVFGTDISSNYDLIKEIYVQLEPFKNRRAGKLSGGMKQKLALCCALIHRPKVLLLDEPTTGVDAVSRREFWDILSKLKKEGITMLVSTPYMDEADRCEHIALIQGGKILSVNTPDDIRAGFGKKLFSVSAPRMSDLLKHLRQHPDVASCYSFGSSHHITLQKGKEETFAVWLNGLREVYGQEVQGKEILPGIEDCFIQLMA